MAQDIDFDRIASDSLGLERLGLQADKEAVTRYEASRSFGTCEVAGLGKVGLELQRDDGAIVGVRATTPYGVVLVSVAVTDDMRVVPFARNVQNDAVAGHLPDIMGHCMVALRRDPAILADAIADRIGFDVTGLGRRMESVEREMASAGNHPAAMDRLSWTSFHHGQRLGELQAALAGVASWAKDGPGEDGMPHLGNGTIPLPGLERGPTSGFGDALASALDGGLHAVNLTLGCMPLHKLAASRTLKGHNLVAFGNGRRMSPTWDRVWMGDMIEERAEDVGAMARDGFPGNRGRPTMVAVNVVPPSHAGLADFTGRLLDEGVAPVVIAVTPDMAIVGRASMLAAELRFTSGHPRP